MASVLVRHKVNNYDTWRPIFEADGERRRAGGCTGTHLFRNLDNPNEVIINLQWDSVENARKFVANPGLEEVMKNAGVVDQPDVYFLDDAGRTAS